MKKYNYSTCCRQSKVYQFSEYDITWGSVSQIKCELFLMQKAADNDMYQYYHLLSGADLPLRTQKEIHDFFNQNCGKEFIHFAPFTESDGTPADDRARYYWATRWYNILPLKKSLSIMRRLDTVQIKVQRAIGVNRLRRWGIQHLYRGANWFSISDQLVREVLQNANQIVKMYSASICCDEVFLQTYIQTHEQWLSRLYYSDMDDNYESIKRAIDWKRGGPYVWRETDYDELMNSGYLFARKFDETIDNKIIDHIYQSIIQK